jgi:hypothetical protein
MLRWECLATNYLYIRDAFYVLGEVIEAINEVKQITQQKEGAIND